MAVLLTRAKQENARFAPRLDAAGIAHMSWPLSRIEQSTAPIALPAGTEALVFTSANGVRAFAATCAERALPVLCVGTRTAEVAREAGFAHVTRAGGTVADLARALPDLPHRHLFYARARDVSADLGAALPPGFVLREQVVYAALAAAAPESNVTDALANGRIEAVTIWSRRNAEVLAEYLSKASPIPLTAAKLVAISQNAAQPLVESGFGRVFIATAPDADGMLAGILAALRQDSCPR